MTSRDTLTNHLLDRVSDSPEAAAFIHSVRNNLATTWAELGREVLFLSEQFVSDGIRTGDHVVHLSSNRYEWILVDLALQFVGAVHIPFHAMITSKNANQLARHCEPKAIVFENREQKEKLADYLADHGQTRVYLVDGDELGGTLLKESQTGRSSSVSDPTDALANLAEGNAVKPDTLLSILYTSGTTGDSKGVMLSQRNVASNVFSKLQVLPLTPDDVRLCILPLTHIFARTCDLYTWIASGSQLAISRGKNFWAEELQEFRPTYINAVPYFYERWYRQLQSANQLDVEGALKSRLGNRVRIANCGGAAISRPVFDYYWQNGVPLITGYGLTETSPVLSSSSPQAIRAGAVGRAVAGVELKIAADGEVLTRGDNVMSGYFKNENATDRTFRDGWFCTGDIGRIDDDGFLFLVGRKTELIVTNTGKNISPVAIETRLNEHPWIEQSMVFGDQQDFLTALVTLSEQGQASKSNSMQSVAEILQAPMEDWLGDFESHERAVVLLETDEPFSLANEMLTPKGSLRRNQIREAYGERMNAAYKSLRQAKKG